MGDGLIPYSVSNRERSTLIDFAAKRAPHVTLYSLLSSIVLLRTLFREHACCLLFEEKSNIILRGKSRTFETLQRLSEEASLRISKMLVYTMLGILLCIYPRPALFVAFEKCKLIMSQDCGVAML